MKITVQDTAFINWQKVREKLLEDCLKAVSEAGDKAIKALPDLKPGQTKTFTINVGKITISKPSEKHLA